MDLTTGIWVGMALFLVILVPYLVWEIRRGKKHGHTWFTWFKPRGHSDIGPDRSESPSAYREAACRRRRAASRQLSGRVSRISVLAAFRHER